MLATRLPPTTLPPRKLPSSTLRPFGPARTKPGPAAFTWFQPHLFDQAPHFGHQLWRHARRCPALQQLMVCDEGGHEERAALRH